MAAFILPSPVDEISTHSNPRLTHTERCDRRERGSPCVFGLEKQLFLSICCSCELYFFHKQRFGGIYVVVRIYGVVVLYLF